MSVSAAHADAFYRELATGDAVWTIEDDGGVPAPQSGDGQRSMPFWSRESRARAVIEGSPAYVGFRTREIPLAEWVARWLPGLRSDGILVGLNWSGARATGYDVEPGAVLQRLAAE
ncbi:MAG: hypothetical protein JWN36_598 [Microbacteriaceae bacterium]|nr:hypothetical protein [Microbacteriaceae bacterium]